MLYTKRGDTGLTDMADGNRVPKNSAAMEAIGTLDELNAHLGVLSAHLASIPDADFTDDLMLLTQAQRRLFAIGALCASVPSPVGLPSEEDTEALEKAMDHCTELLGTAFSGFILPGGHLAATECHVARTVCRRAERRLLDMEANEWANAGFSLPYLNRMSDYLFALARKINFLTKTKEIKY